jgi:phosphoribosylformylglycinamidine synthase
MFVGLCEERGIPVLRIGITHASGPLEIQDLATLQIEELRNFHGATIPELFG